MTVQGWQVGLGRTLGLLALAAACGGTNAGNGDAGAVEPCTVGLDSDGDGFGEGCPAGPDCNDGDPGIHTNCPDADCGASPFTGCPCDPATDTPISCFDGPADSATTPPCEKGTRTCDATLNMWGACVGQTLPAFEDCDRIDNDCDGEADEAPADCEGSGIDTEPFPLPPDPDVGADGVGLDPNGDLVLDSSTFENHFLWIANDAEGTVSKIDTRTGREVGRYPSVTHDPAASVDATEGAGGPIPAWNDGTGGGGYSHNRPSRTTIDFAGDMWVANRAFGYQPSATKIINNAPDECTDRNGNGMIDTSSDVNGNGVIDFAAGLPEFVGEADECIKFTVKVGNVDGLARALAIDSGIEPGDPGNAWVGMFNEQAFYQLDGNTGARLQRVPIVGNPYGAAIDSRGHLWAANNCCNAGLEASLIHIDTTMTPAMVLPTVTVPGLSGNGSYGITIDLEDRIWVGAWPQGLLKRYNPADGTFAEAIIPENFGAGYGVRGVGIDAIGNVWAALHVSAAFADGRVARIDADSATATGWWDITGEVPVGVGVDFDGDVWTVNQNSSNASRLHIDAVTHEPTPHPMTGSTVDLFPVGNLPYTYSDFTGLGLRVVTRPSGEYRVIKEGCQDQDLATWMSVTWSATTPPNTRVEIWVRVGDDRATLGSQPQYGPWTVSPADLSMAPGPVPPARFIELTIKLISEDRESTPIVHSYGLTWSCPGEPIP